MTSGLGGCRNSHLTGDDSIHTATRSRASELIRARRLLPLILGLLASPLSAPAQDRLVIPRLNGPIELDGMSEDGESE